MVKYKAYKHFSMSQNMLSIIRTSGKVLMLIHFLKVLMSHHVLYQDDNVSFPKRTLCHFHWTKKDNVSFPERTMCPLEDGKCIVAEHDKLTLPKRPRQNLHAETCAPKRPRRNVAPSTPKRPRRNVAPSTPKRARRTIFRPEFFRRPFVHFLFSLVLGFGRPI